MTRGSAVSAVPVTNAMAAMREPSRFVKRTSTHSPGCQTVIAAARKIQNGSATGRYEKLSMV